MTKANALLEDANLYSIFKQRLWTDAYKHAALLNNILPMPNCDNKSPLEAAGVPNLANKIFHSNNFHVFGSLAVLTLEKDHRDTKPSNKGELAIYLGVAPDYDSSTALFYNIETNTYPVYSSHFKILNKQACI